MLWLKLMPLRSADLVRQARRVSIPAVAIAAVAIAAVAIAAVAMVVAITG